MRDSKSLTEARYHQIEDSDPIEEGTRDAARLVICANAESPSEAVEWMMMLGVHPSQDLDVPFLTGVSNLPNPTTGTTL